MTILKRVLKFVEHISLHTKKKAFTCRCPNVSGVGAIDSPDRLKQVLDQRYTPEVSEKNFTDDISMIRRQKMVIFGVLNVFISNFTSYNLY